MLGAAQFKVIETMDTFGEAFAVFHKIAAHASGLFTQIAELQSVKNQAEEVAWITNDSGQKECKQEPAKESYIKIEIKPIHEQMKKFNVYYDI